MLLPIVDSPAPSVPLEHLDDLWFQVAGTLCNLTCNHCFISCSPHNHNFGFLDLATVQKALDESVQLGVKEYYFTGGEPFLNPDMTAILETTLQYGPASVLTNGTVFKDQWLQQLSEAEKASSYSLEFRVSIDGFNPEENDPVRGEGTFVRAMKGVQQLVAYGFLPIITVTRTDDEQDDAQLVKGFITMLQSYGYDNPRLKILPTLRMGAEQDRTRGYHEEERITPEMMQGFDESQLICHHSRVVTDKGIYVCPILIEAADARMGDSLPSSLEPYELRHHACYTCYQYGSLCSNPSSGNPSEW